ncbi:MAG: hypothetical protein WCG25_09290 [bacterium]
MIHSELHLSIQLNFLYISVDIVFFVHPTSDFFSIALPKSDIFSSKFLSSRLVMPDMEFII